MKKLFRNECGQSLVLIAVAMSVIFGCAGLAIDSGRVHNEQIRVQNATDFAALASVQGFPTYSRIYSYAAAYAELNCDDMDVLVELLDSETVRVTGTKELPYTFARILGFESATITATATAKKVVADGSMPPAADCYPETTTKIHQWPENGRATYTIQVDSPHRADPSHETNRQTLVLCFNRPVFYVDSRGTCTGGSGTNMLTIDYGYFNNAYDNIGLGDIYVACEGNPMDLAVTASVMLCEKGKTWPFVAGDVVPNVGPVSAALIG